MKRTADDQIDDQGQDQGRDSAGEYVNGQAHGGRDELRGRDTSSFAAGGSSADDTAFDPATHPAPQFRGDLLRALEQTHRQQAAQRVLGAHYSAYQQQLDEQRRQRWLLALLTALVAFLVFAMIQWRKIRYQ